MKLVLIHTMTGLKGLLRTPGYWLPVVFIPTIMYSFFGLSNSNNPELANIFVGSWSVFAVLGIAVFQFGVSIAMARQSPWEAFTRTWPTGPGARFAAQVLLAVIFSIMALALLWTVAALFAPVEMSGLQWGKLGFSAVLGGAPFALLGIAIGFAFSPRAALPIANLLYLALAYLGGLFMPPQYMPEAVQSLSRIMPTRHFGELAWSVVLDLPFPWISVLWLAGWSVIFILIGRWGWKRDQLERFG